MDFGNIPLNKAMEQKLKYHSARQVELSRNVANVDTPGYLAHDVQSPDFSAMLSKASPASSMAVTHPGHMRPGFGLGGVPKAIDRDSTYDLNPIGNNVVIEEEMMKVGENQAEYQKILSIYRKNMDMYRMALGRPGGA